MIVFYKLKSTTSGYAYYSVYDPSIEYYLLDGYDDGCDGTISWDAWDFESSDWVNLEDGCVVPTEVSRSTKGGDRKDANNERPSHPKPKKVKKGQK